jgi:hypothetical protein
MFIQVMQGRTSDAAGLRRQMDRWNDELRSGAAGFLGTTAGVSDDGRFVAFARFESPDAARRNSGRAEQGAWWEETAKYFDGEVEFHDCEEVDTLLGGGSNDARFVQIITGRTSRRDELVALEQEVVSDLGNLRPELIGSVRGWDGDRFFEAAYFTDEAAAREGESAELPDDVASAFEQYNSLMEGVEYLDLREPWLH